MALLILIGAQVMAALFLGFGGVLMLGFYIG